MFSTPQHLTADAGSTRSCYDTDDVTARRRGNMVTWSYGRSTTPKCPTYAWMLSAALRASASVTGQRDRDWALITCGAFPGAVAVTAWQRPQGAQCRGVRRGILRCSLDGSFGFGLTQVLAVSKPENLRNAKRSSKNRSPYAAAFSGAQGLPGEMATPGRITGL